MKGLSLLLAVLASFFLSSMAAAAVEKEWTVLVYLCADNNLDELGLDNQREMASVGSNDHLNVVTLLDRFHAPANVSYVEKNNIRVIREMGEVDMGDYRVLVQFVKDMVTRYPARHYALIIFNHGTGWRSSSGKGRGISYDDSSGNHITTNQLQTAMAEVKQQLGRNLDVLGMDACLMQMVEVAWAVRASVDFVVASEEVEPQEGYPYNTILASMNPGMTPTDFCKAIVRAYSNFYSSYEFPDETMLKKASRPRSLETTQSAITCSRLPVLASRLDEVCSRLMQGNSSAQMKIAVGRVQRFASSGHADLSDFLSQLKATAIDAELVLSIDAALAALKGAVIAHAQTDDQDLGPAVDTLDKAFCGSIRREFRTNGLAVFLPPQSSAMEKEYADIAWAKETLWDDMLVDFFKKSESAAIAEDLEQKSTVLLRSFLQGVNESNIPLAQEILTLVKFQVFCEKPLPPEFQKEIQKLISRPFFH